MDHGVSYTFKSAAYPRYRYFQQHLWRLVDRWQKILDAGSLPDCTSQGKIKLKEIMSAANQTEEKVKVNVFADSSFLETRLYELALQCNKKISGDVRSTRWTEFTRGDRKGHEPVVTVIVLPSQEEKSIRGVKDQLSHVAKSLLKSIIVYFADSKISVPYCDIAKSDFEATETDKADYKAAESGKTLDKQIQNLLEDKVISVLEQIAAYNTPFIPKKQEDLVEPLENAVQQKLLSSMRNPFVVKDLSPDANDAIEGTERKPTEEDLLELASALSSNWEMLGPALGISTTQIDQIKQTYSGNTRDQIYNMLLLWKERGGAKLMYLLQVMENVSTVIYVDTAILKEMQEKSPATKTDSEKDKLFHASLLDFVTKKTKCVVCDKLAEKFGMSSSLINEFLNEGFFGYEKKVEEMMSAMKMPSWPRDKSDDGVSTCKMFSYQCCSNMSKMIHETEAYIKAKHEILMLLKKLQFQLFGLLEDTEVEVETVIPEIPKLPTELQHALLDVSGVYGCGTVWGDLVIHVNNELLPVKREEVKTLLEQHKYIYGFRTELVESEQEDAGGFTTLEHGSGIRARKLNPDVDGNYKYGSLGCFVNVKLKTDEATNVTQTDAKLHGLTCAHCVDECDSKVEIRHGTNYTEFGEKRHFIYEPHALDVATVEIDTTKTGSCDKSLKNGNRESCENWQVFENPPVRMPVYKYGSATGLTLGTCVSNNYETTKMMDNWNKKLKNERLCPIHNILISRENIQQGIEGITVQQHADPTGGEEPMMLDSKVTDFSEAGDSGSVVCKDDPDGKSVKVVALLSGTVKTSQEKYSYSSHVYKTIEELQRRFDCIIEPAQPSSEGKIQTGTVYRRTDL